MLIQFVMLMAFLSYYIYHGTTVRPSAVAFLFPVMVLWIGALGAGFGMIVSSVTAKYRDLRHIVNLTLRLAMYVTPVIYPLAQIPQRWRFFFYINPLSAPMELFRVWFYGVGAVPLKMTLISIVVTFLVLFIGLILFNRTERTCMDVI
jgi:lipopolysaccharide transport system permease protein